jgi:hypothetical protein
MFEGARLKVKRANKHIVDFNDVLNAFLNTDFYVFDIEADSNTGQSSLNFRLTKQPPEELALILGDALHNLRTALDLSYVELVIRLGKTPSEWTNFRIWENREKLIDTLGKGILQGADDIISLLADTVKSYAGGNALLEMLNSLDIADKHMLLIPVFSIGKLMNFDADVEMPGGGCLTMRRCSASVDQRGTVRVIGMSGTGKLHIHNKGQPSIDVRFGDVAGLKGQPVVPMFHQLTQVTLGTVQAFESALAVRSAGAV